jgi:hypothetical protein
MVDVVSMEEFDRKTVGGVPLKKRMNVFDGIPYECGCGETHQFSPSQTRVFCELGGRDYVFWCLNEYLTLVKVKGFATHKFKSLLSAKKEEGTPSPG